MDVTHWYIGLALVFGLYMAWNIGANDVANAMGTSVGSGALTLRRAVIIAAVMEFCGAFFVGPHVSETVRQGIVDLNIVGEDPELLLLGMLAALLAAGGWLQLASYFGWPVSTTHSIVGAIVGFGLVQGGPDAVQWGKLGSIVASWVVSPALAGLVAFVIFRLVLTGIFYKPDPVAAAKKATPWIAGLVIVVMMLVLAFKGLKPFWKTMGFDNPQTGTPLAIGLGGAVVLGLLATAVGKYMVQRIGDADPVSADHARNIYLVRALSKAIMHLRRVRNTSVGATRDEADRVLQDTQAIYRTLDQQTTRDGASNAFLKVERIFIVLQVISAAFVAFAHGANDVANAIGPMSVVVEIANSKPMAVPKEATVGTIMLMVGGVGIVAGLAMWGWRVMQTVGRRITELTPSRGFCAEFAAALTILIASVYKLPISTTHTLVGAVLGVGMARGIGALNLNTVRDIAVS